MILTNWITIIYLPARLSCSQSLRNQPESLPVPHFSQPEATLQHRKHTSAQGLYPQEGQWLILAAKVGFTLRPRDTQILVQPSPLESPALLTWTTNQRQRDLPSHQLLDCDSTAGHTHLPTAEFPLCRWQPAWILHGGERWLPAREAGAGSRGRPSTEGAPSLVSAAHSANL